MHFEGAALIGRHGIERAANRVLVRQHAHIVARQIASASFSREGLVKFQSPAGASSMHQIYVTRDGKTPTA
jgi:hypothetical protein